MFKKILHQLLEGKTDRDGKCIAPVVNTNLGRAFGSYESTYDGLNVDQSDMQYLQSILKQNAMSKTLHSAVVMQSMMYRNMATEAITGVYDSSKDNVGCHISPVLAAMFLPKIKLFEDTFIWASISCIVKCRYEKRPLMSKEDYALLFSLVSDPNDVVCDIDSPYKDLLNRVLLQETVWQSVNALRSGR